MPRPSYDRGVHRARQAPRTVIGLVLIALAAISWGTSGSVMTVLAERAAASPLLVGVARLWIAAIFLLVATAVTARGVVVATGDRWRCLAMGACMAAYQAAYFTAVTLAGIAVVALVRFARRAHDRGARALAARRASPPAWRRAPARRARHRPARGRAAGRSTCRRDFSRRPARVRRGARLRVVRARGEGDAPTLGAASRDGAHVHDRRASVDAGPRVDCAP